MCSNTFAWMVTCLLVMTTFQGAMPGASLSHARGGQANVHAVRAGSADGTTHGPPRCPSATHGGTTPRLCAVYITGSTALTLDERTNRVFVARERGDAGYVSVFDARSGALLRTVTVGMVPLSIADDAATGHVFVTNQGEPNIKGSRSVSMLDARTGAVLHTTHVRGDPINLAAAGHVVTIDANDSNVNVLDAASGRLVASLTLPRPPLTVAAAAHAGRLFVANNYTTTVLDARTGRVLRTVPGAAGFMVVDERSGRVYTASGVVLDARSGAPLHLHLAQGGDRMIVDAPRRRVIGITSVSVDISDADSGRLLHRVSISIDNQPASAPVVIERTGHILVLLSSPTDDDGNYVGPGYLLVVDERSGAVVRRMNANGSMGTYGPSDSIAVDNRTNRVFVLDEHGLDVFDATRL